MLSEKISKNILTIGCSYRNPKGGIAMVMKNYEDYVFPDFKCVVNSGGKNKFEKLFKGVYGLILMFSKLLFDRKIKIVHIHTASYNSFKRSIWYLRLAKFFRKKVILHIHGGGFKDYYATNPKWISKMLNKSDGIIVLSESWKEYFQTITQHPEIFIVENIVAEPINGEKHKSDKFELLFLGLINPAKGIFDLLEVLKENINEFSGKVLLHIGGNGNVDELKQKIEEYGLSDMVAFEGFVSGDKKTELLQNCDAYILPSYVEGLPISILEAMSYKKPILSTPVGGIPEVVKDGVNGILFDPGDKNAIASAIIKLQQDNNLLKQMEKESYRIIQPHFPDNVISKLEQVYKELLYSL